MYSSFLPWVASVLAIVIGLAAVLRKRSAMASWLFFAGMILFGAELLLTHHSFQTMDPQEGKKRVAVALLVRSLWPGIWLCFSMIYCRKDGGDLLSRWKFLLLSLCVIPIAYTWICYPYLADLVPSGRSSDHVMRLELLAPAKGLILMLLVVTVCILFNFEKTFRSTIGVTRWGAKYFFLGLVLLFGTRLYTLSQVLLYSEFSPVINEVSSLAVIFSCSLMAISYARKGFGEFEIHPSRLLLQRSLTILLAGGYLMVVGGLAHVAALRGRSEYFPFAALIVLTGVVGLAALLLSDRMRDRMHHVVTRHFHRPQYDYQKVWMDSTARISSAMDRSSLCKNAVELVAKTFHVLSVYVFVADVEEKQLVRLATATHDTVSEEEVMILQMDLDSLYASCAGGRSLNLEEVDASWAQTLREQAPSIFSNGGDRRIVSLTAGQRLLGLMILADRVNGTPYSVEETELLECMSDQIAAALLNASLTDELVRARELEAFRTMSTFFAHDLKNAANGLNLMLQNLPVHFDDPAFREDALRGIGKTVDRINRMVERLSTLRQSLVIEPVEVDLNQIVREVLERLNGEMGELVVNRRLAPLPRVRIDHEQIRSVVTNLMVNAREATNGHGEIVIDTKLDQDRVVLTVADNGCGMSSDFIKRHLFRPFHSTKSKGLGIGMFQSRMIVEAHKGSIQVESSPDQGTIFHVMLPV